LIAYAYFFSSGAAGAGSCLASPLLSPFSFETDSPQLLQPESQPPQPESQPEPQPLSQPLLQPLSQPLLQPLSQPLLQPLSHDCSSQLEVWYPP
jgi:hypothetical protein